MNDAFDTNIRQYCFSHIAILAAIFGFS